MSPVGQEKILGNFETLRVLGRAFRYAAPFRRRFAIKYLLSLGALLPLFITPWPVKIIVDHVIEARPVLPANYPAFLRPFTEALSGLPPNEILLWMIVLQAALLVLVGAVGTGGGERDRAESHLAGGHDQASRTENEANEGWSLASGLFGLIDFRFTIQLTQALNHHYRSRLFERIQALPMAVFDDERIGDAVFRVMYDTPAITHGVYRIILTPFTGAAFALATVGVIFLLFGDQPIFWQAALGMLAISLVVSLPFTGILRRRSRASREAGASTTSSLEEGLSNILAVQSLGAENREQDRFGNDSWSAFANHRAVMVVGMGIFFFALLPGMWLGTKVFLYGADMVIAGAISRGDFILLFTYFLYLLFTCIDLGTLWIRLQESAVGLHRVFFLMDLPTEEEAPGTPELPQAVERVEIRNAHYAYPDGTPALRGVNLDLERGEIVALVGPAGAGKTTLAGLIPRFHDPDEGRVLFDGADARNFTRTSIREQVAFVFQETVLFDASVEENIRLGRPDASDADVRRAAVRAGADEFIRELPQAYRTRLGRGGGKLSVGQKQRIGIARALVRTSPILILDEPTSALDPETERALVETMEEARRERSVLVIAHRLSTIRHADRIAFVDEGQILEIGSHADLMARPDGAYRRFVELQTVGAA
ncbi:MAG: ABC transporter ATP-binding protein [Deltaproteobacteria bacterium]|nr:ABC transporter ATP-binding protein [Deltaproteobacteria bacterium]